jgi:cell division protease FtsH
MSRSRANSTICVLLGGRVAEEQVLGELTSGAGNDLDRTTDLARKMVCEWGMSEKLGPLTFGKKEEQIFLGREIAQHRDYSEKTAQDIDAEVRKLVEDCHTTVRELIKNNVDSLHRMAEALLVFETLDTNDVNRLVKGLEIDRPKPLETKLISPDTAGLGGEPKSPKDDLPPEPEPEPEPGMA